NHGPAASRDPTPKHHQIDVAHIQSQISQTPGFKPARNGQPHLNQWTATCPSQQQRRQACSESSPADLAARSSSEHLVMASSSSNRQQPSIAALQVQSRCRNGWPIHISADQGWATQSEGQPTHITVHRLSAAKSNPEKSGQ
ncbi:hypothetical protein ACLOJK_007455, partial [Asimina triloba]